MRRFRGVSARGWSGVRTPWWPSALTRRLLGWGTRVWVGKTGWFPDYAGEVIAEGGGGAREGVFSRVLFGRLAAVFFVFAGVVTAVSLALPLPAGQHRGPLGVVSVVAVAAGGVVWVIPWDRWRPVVLRWTVVPAALVLIAAAYIVGGVDAFSYGVTFALVFVWVGLSQPPWASLRFAVPAVVAYVAPLLVHDRPAGDVATVGFVVPVCLGIAEGCGFVAERLRRAQWGLRVANAGVEGLLRATTELVRAGTETAVADVTVELAQDLLGADRVLVMVAATGAPSRFVVRAGRNVSVDAELVVDAAVEPTAVGHVVRTGRTLFVADVAASPVVSPRLAGLVGGASAVFVPLPGEGGFLGALVALWDVPRASLDSFSQRAAEVLSAESGRALEQARAAARLARDLDEQTSAAETLLAERGLLELLGAVTAAANEARTPGEAFRRVLDEVCLRTGWPVGHAYTADETGSLVSGGVWHLDDVERFAAFRVATEAVGVPPSVGVPGRVAVSGQPVWLADLTTEMGHPRDAVARDSGLGGTLVFPVLVDGQVAVVFEFFSCGRRPVDEALFDLTAHLGAQLGRMLERRRAEEALQASEERTRSVIETAGDPYIGMDDAGLICEWNQQAERIFGWARHEALGRAVADLIVPDALRPAHRDGVRRFLETGEATILGRPVQLQAVTRTGREFPVELTVWVTRLEESWAFHAFVRDISERARFEAELTRQALHDSLTGLPNRTLLLDRLAHALARAARPGSAVTVLFLDLDGFKTVNDSLGHDVGDRLLVAVAERLRRAVRPSDTIARLGGDEFAVLLEDTETSGGITVAERFAAILATPVLVDARQVFVPASIGIATGRPAECTAGELLRDADLAMYMAKGRGKGAYVVFEATMHHAALERLELEADLRRALPDGEMLVHYQPIVRLEDLAVVGAEALLRWRRGGQDLVPPGMFVPVAEETGVIIDIGRWALHEACRQARTWQTEHRLTAALHLSVNVSARQVHAPGLVADVAAALAGSGLDPACLVLELTESVLMEDPDRAAATLNELKALGVRLAIDDFGTGYSSLAYLQRFPIDILKIDRSFVARIGGRPEDAALAHAIIKLGQTLHLDVIAEGIETDDQLNELRNLGCEYGQGYLIARPLAPDAMTTLLDAHETG